MTEDAALAYCRTQQADVARLVDIAGAMVAEIAAPAPYHAIWIQSAVIDGKFVNTIRASVRPGYEAQVSVPDEFQGVPIFKTPWPEDAA